MTGSLGFLSDIGLFDDPKGSEEENRLGLALTCINESNDPANEHEDSPDPSYDRNDADKGEQEHYKSLVCIELEIIGTLSVNISAEVCNDNTVDAEHDRNDSEHLIARINGCISNMSRCCGCCLLILRLGLRCALRLCCSCSCSAEVEAANCAEYSVICYLSSAFRTSFHKSPS